MTGIGGVVRHTKKTRILMKAESVGTPCFDPTSCGRFLEQPNAVRCLEICFFGQHTAARVANQQYEQAMVQVLGQSAVKQQACGSASYSMLCQ